MYTYFQSLGYKKKKKKGGRNHYAIWTNVY